MPLRAMPCRRRESIPPSVRAAARHAVESLESRTLLSTYYVDPAGSDAASGLSAATAWRSLAKVDATAFQPGDNVLLKRGGEWAERLVPLTSGAAGAPITFGAYGDDALPDPKIWGSDPIANAAFTRLSGTAQAWQAPFATPASALLVSNNFYRNVRAITGSADNATNKAALDSNPFTFWQDQSAGILYVNPGAHDPNTDGRSYRASVRDAAVDSNAQSYLTFQDLVVDGSAVIRAFWVRGGSHVTVEDCAAYRAAQFHFAAHNTDDFVARRLEAAYAAPDLTPGSAAEFHSFSDAGRSDDHQWLECAAYAPGVPNHIGFLSIGAGIGSVLVRQLRARDGLVVGTATNGARIVGGSIDGPLGVYGSYTTVDGLTVNAPAWRQQAVDLEGTFNVIQNSVIHHLRPDSSASYLGAILDNGHDNTIRFNTIDLDPATLWPTAGVTVRYPDSRSHIYGNVIRNAPAPILRWFGGAGQIDSDYNVFSPSAVAGGFPDVVSWSGMSLANWRALGRDVHSVVADPQARDPANGDFSPLPGSPAIDAFPTNLSAYPLPATDFDGSARPEGAAADMGAYETPAAPTSLGANAVTASRIDLTWSDPSANDDGYTLERSTSSNFAGTTTITIPAGARSYSDTGLSANTTYYYRLRAARGSMASAYSNTASATTPAAQPPATPLDFMASPDGLRMHLSWTRVDGADGYNVYRHEGPWFGDLTELTLLPGGQTQSNQLDDLDVLPSTHYTYGLVAVNAVGRSDMAIAPADTGAAPVKIIGESSVSENHVPPYSLTLSRGSLPPTVTIGHWEIDWGDGSGRETVNGNPGSATHTFADGPNHWHVTATAYDANSSAHYDAWAEQPNGVAYARGHMVVNVDNVAPTVTLDGGSDINEGQPYTLTLSATGDPGPDTVSRWEIHWGDQSGPAHDGVEVANGNPPSVPHVYADDSGARRFSITALAFDEDTATGYPATNARDVTVHDVRPTVTSAGANATAEGATYVLHLAYSDPGDDPVQSWTVNWGDGTQNVYTAAAYTGKPVSADVTHVYAASRSAAYTITATVNNGDGDFAATKAVTVTDVPPAQVTIGGAATADEGQPYTLNLSAGGDPGPDVITSWTVTWGDGAVQTYAGGNSLSVTHTFAPGTATATVSATANDGDGPHPAGNTLAVAVVPAAPVGLAAIVASGPAVQLTWVDNSGIETGYEVQRKVDLNGTWLPLADLSAGSAQFLDGGVADGTRYYYRARAHGAAGDSAWSAEASAVPLTPRIASGGEARATPDPVTGTTVELSVLGELSPPGSESDLTYTWTVTSSPAGAPTVQFNRNNSNAAKSTTATFGKAGPYTFEATVKNGTMADPPSPVTVEVQQTTTSIAVTPSNVTLEHGDDQQFTAEARDQFGDLMDPEPSFAWAVEPAGLGQFVGDGMYRAPDEGTGTVTVRASADGVSGTATVTIGVAEVIGPWGIVAAPVSATMISGQPSDWHGGVTTVQEAFTGISIIADGAIFATGDVLELTFAPGTLANGTGPDLVVFNLEWSQDAYAVACDYDNFAQEFMIGNGTQLPDGSQSTYDWDDIHVPGPSSSGGRVVAKAIDLDYFGVPDGQVVERLRVRTTDGRGGADLLGVGSLNLARVDLDVDSDNTGLNSAPDGSDDEDDAEDEAAGKLVIVNRDDADTDGILDFADGFEAFEDTSDDVTAAGGWFVPVELHVPGGLGPDTTVEFDYDAADPTDVTHAPIDKPGLDGITYTTYDYSVGDGLLRLWRQPGDAARSTSDFIEPNRPYSLAALGLSEATELSLYLEAVNGSATATKIKVTLRPNAEKVTSTLSASGWSSSECGCASMP